MYITFNSHLEFRLLREEIYFWRSLPV